MEDAYHEKLRAFAFVAEKQYKHDLGLGLSQYALRVEQTWSLDGEDVIPHGTSAGIQWEVIDSISMKELKQLETELNQFCAMNGGTLKGMDIVNRYGRLRLNAAIDYTPTKEKPAVAARRVSEETLADWDHGRRY